MTSDITIIRGVEVSLIDFSGSDAAIAQAARVSLAGANEAGAKKSEGLIRVLMEKKHGTPFEHTFLKFHVKAPIFVFREFHRHRAGFSYNEMSGRYMELPGEFYAPRPERPLHNVGTSMNPVFAPAGKALADTVSDEIVKAYEAAWDTYQHLLGMNIANEVARVVLPVGIMSQMYVSCNVRSLLHFLELRTADERAAYPSKPQYEIELVARKMEGIIAVHFPETYKAFNDLGRVAP